MKFEETINGLEKYSFRFLILTMIIGSSLIMILLILDIAKAMIILLLK